jgi:hypothetical protein
VCSYYCVCPRTTVTNEQFAHCSEFVRDYGDRDGDGYLSYEELEDIDPEML